jgi:hypothetical protein
MDAILRGKLECFFPLPAPEYQSVGQMIRQELKPLGLWGVPGDLQDFLRNEN